MDPHTEFLRRRRWWITGLVALFGLGVITVLPRVNAGTSFALTPLAMTLFFVWSIAGGNWVMRARTGSSNVTATDDARRRRIYLVALLPAGGFLWRRLEDVARSSPDSLGEAIFVPVLWIAGAVFFWWMFASLMWRFISIQRASQDKDR